MMDNIFDTKVISAEERNFPLRKRYLLACLQIKLDHGMNDFGQIKIKGSAIST